MLDLELDREGVPTKDAATLILVRDASAGGVEVFCVERSKGSKFLGGAIVFPGGKLDVVDRDEVWRELATAPRTPHTALAADDDTLRALAVAACRETLEEAAILPLVGEPLGDTEAVALRDAIARKETSLAAFVRARGTQLDLAALYPFARWVTPTAEARRFDARFYVAAVGTGQSGKHDAHETTATFWARPGDVLARFVAGEIQLAPPTHRSLEILATAANARAVLDATATASLAPICPRLVRQAEAAGDTMALTLPGDPEHPSPTPHAAGHTRYVLRDGRFLPEDPPAISPRGTPSAR
jgi:8-oxo-dGTP pyrophosphatase MutT (NUDIX family)